MINKQIIEELIFNAIENQTYSILVIQFSILAFAQMNVLESQPLLSIETNQCKSEFLNNEIGEMKDRKEIYLQILHQLKLLLKETSIITQNQQKSTVLSNSKKSITKSEASINAMPHNLKPIDNKTQQSTQYSQQNCLNEESLNARMRQFTQILQQKIENYCCSEISQNILKFIEIQREQTVFYPNLINHLKDYIKVGEKYLTQREKQLVDIEDIKCLASKALSNKDNVIKDGKNFKPKMKQNQNQLKNTQRVISTFNFNRIVLEVAKKEMALLKLRKRRLQIQLQKNILPQSDFLQSARLFQPIQNSSELNNQQTGKLSYRQGVNEQLNLRKLPSLKKNGSITHQSKQHKSKNSETSPFEQLVLVYQKDKFLNDLMEQKVRKLQKKLKSQKKQNTLLKQKKQFVQKQIQKLDWNNVCNNSFINMNNHLKHMETMNLSILDRTYLRQCGEIDRECSQMNINQSIIKGI